MARHALEVHPGEEPQFGMTIVRTYTSAFTLAMGEVIRILYRSREKGVVLLNSKAGDFASYSLPRLSVSNLEEGQEAPSNRDRSRKCQRNESRSGKGSDLSSKSKNFVKSPCLNVKRAKTRPASRKKLRSNGTWAKQFGNHNKVKTDEERLQILIGSSAWFVVFVSDCDFNNLTTIMYSYWSGVFTQNASSFFPVVWLIWSHQSAKRVAKLYLVSKYKEVNPIEVHLCA